MRYNRASAEHIALRRTEDEKEVGSGQKRKKWAEKEESEAWLGLGWAGYAGGRVNGGRGVGVWGG